VSSHSFSQVELCEVSRQFGRRRALWKVSLTLRAGEIVGLFGPNGAGKSTLLSIVSTALRPSAGAVHYGDRPASAFGDEIRGHIGVLGHDLFLYGDLTARENLAFFGRLYGVRPLEPRVDEALAAARLTDRAGDRVSTFSRGLRQRLALERALVHRPGLVLLDEPFTGLDEESAVLLIGRLRQLRDAGAIVVLATHDFESAHGLIDRMVCLRDGRGRELTTTGHPRERYRSAMAEAWT